MIPLEHFHYGQLVHHGKPTGDMRVLARSSAVTDDQVADTIRHALISPLKDSSFVSWAILRGKVVPFILAQSQIGTAGQTILHFVLLPPDAVRTIAGNLQIVQPWLKDSLPIYEKLGDRLVPIALQESEAPSADAQVDVLLDLMTYTKNKTRNIEALLSAVVEGVPLVIVNAPPDEEPRTNLVQGLLTLLPVSTRFGVTFATHLDKSARINAQISFMDRSPSKNAIVYDWENGSIKGNKVEGEYSRFIVSQLRLDAGLVIQQTETLTPVAGWRYKRGDRLADALAYASHRLRLDNAVQSNQPVPVESVSQTLADDPTLTDELRLAYARHLISLSIGLDNMEYTEPAAVLLHNQPELSESAYRQLSEALNEGKSELVYDTLLRWMTNPLGPQGKVWIDLLYRSTLAFLDECIRDQDGEAVKSVLEDVKSAPPGSAMGKTAPKVIEKTLAMVAQDNSLAAPILGLGLSHLPVDVLSQLFNARALRNYLPQSTRILLQHLNGELPPPAQPGILIAAAEFFGEGEQHRELLRLTEMAQIAKRLDLVDTQVLEVLVQTAQSPERENYRALLISIVKTITESSLTHLAEPGPRYLLQILLILGQYGLLTRHMIAQSRDLYAGDRQVEYLQLVRQLFRSVAMDEEQGSHVLRSIRENGIKGLPLVMATLGILEASDWAPALSYAAEEVVTTLEDTPRYLEFVHPSAMVTLLRYYASQHDTDKSIYVASVIPSIAATHGSAGLRAMRHVITLMDWDKEAKRASVDILRRFIRISDEKTARRAVQHFGKEFGKSMQRRLQATYTLGRFMGNVEIGEYILRLRQATDLLRDISEAYHKSSPDINDLIDSYDIVRTGTPGEMQQQISKSLLSIGKSIIVLGNQQRSRSGLNEKNITGLLSGEQAPRGSLDVLIVMSSRIQRGRRYPLDIESYKGRNPFRGRSGEDLHEEAQRTHALLRGMVRALPPEKPLRLSAKDIRDEVQSIWSTLPAPDQQVLADEVTRHWQHLAELISMIARNGDSRALETGSSLARKIDSQKHRPKSVLEMLRFMYALLK